MPAPELLVAPECRDCPGRTLSTTACQVVMDEVVNNINRATAATEVKATDIPADFCGDGYVKGQSKPIHLLEKNYA